MSEGFDVIVLGTGAAGLSAAIAAHDAGASMGLFEKVGGTAALSGGMVWMPRTTARTRSGSPTAVMTPSPPSSSCRSASPTAGMDEL